MERRTWPQLLVLVPVAAMLGFGSAPSAGDSVSGVITRTYVIVEDTDLTGDVTCDVTGAACFSFGAPDVELRLNGFSITGKADPVTACAGAALTANEGGIFTNNQHKVRVRGPGLVQRFRQHGVWVGGSQDARVEGITASTNCGSGVFIAANAFGTLVENNTSVRNGSAAAPCGGV
jgi:nitrous oxidase accessory protein NosD